MATKREHGASTMAINPPPSQTDVNQGPVTKRVKQISSPRRKSVGGKHANRKKKILKVKLYRYATNPQLAHVLESAERAVNNDMYDTEAWLQLMSYAQTVTPINDAIRTTYEAFLKIFPTASKYWRHYCRSEIDAGRFDLAEQLFTRCLVKCPDPELWLVYVSYIQRTKAGQPNELTAVTAACEFALSHVGEDVFSSPIWQAYAEFLQKMASVATLSPTEKQTRVDALRALLQRAVVTPFEHAESLWKMYDAFEHSVNPSQARALIAPLVGRHFSANACAAQRRAHKQRVPQHALARPLRAQSPGKPVDLSAFNAWRQYIIFEASNPGRATAAVLRARTTLVFEQASLVLRHYPEFWMLYVTYLRQCVKESSTSAAGLVKLKQDLEAVQAVFRRALEAMPYSVLIRLVYANYLEETKMNAEAKAVYESLLVTEKRQQAEAEQKATTAAETSANHDPSSSHGGDISDTDDEIESDDDNLTPDANQQLTTPQNDSEDEEDDAHLENETDEDKRRRGLGFTEGEVGTEITETHPIVYVHYMRFLRRTEGQDSARRFFVLSRRSPAITWHVYIAAAQMELLCNHAPDNAVKILSFGMKEYGHEPGFVLEHINLLTIANDHANLKLLFETVLSSGRFGPDQHSATWLQIWNKYVEFTRDTGESLTTLGKLQLRRNAELGIPPVPVPGVGALTAADAPTTASNTRDNQPMTAAERREKLLAAQQQAMSAGGAAAATMDDEGGLALHRLGVWEMLERFNFLDMTPCSAVYSETQARQRAQQLKASASSAAAAELDAALAGLGAGAEAEGSSSGAVVNGLLILRNLPARRAQQEKMRFPRPNLSLLTELTPTLTKQTAFASQVVARYGHGSHIGDAVMMPHPPQGDRNVPFSSPAFIPPGAPPTGFDLIAAFTNTLPHGLQPPRFTPLFARFLHMMPQPPYRGPPLDIDAIVRVMRVGPPLPAPRGAASALKPDAFQHVAWVVQQLEAAAAPAASAGGSIRPLGASVPPPPGAPVPPPPPIPMQMSQPTGPRPNNATGGTGGYNPPIPSHYPAQGSAGMPQRR